MSGPTDLTKEAGSAAAPYDFGRSGTSAQTPRSAPEGAFPKLSAAITKMRVKRISGLQRFREPEFETKNINIK